nr:hypothetical protein [Kofleriaceae bacterium]
MSAADLGRALEAALTGLIQAAPDLAPAEVEAAADLALATAAALLAPGHDAGLDRLRLALAIERILDDVATGELEQGVALPALAMAASTLGQALAGEVPRLLAGVRAATYELETLLPLPDRGRVRTGGPDVTLDRLSPRLAAATARPGRDRGRIDRLRRRSEDGVDDDLLQALAAARARYD